MKGTRGVAGRAAGRACGASGEGATGQPHPFLWLTQQFLCARCPGKLRQAPWAAAQAHLPLCSHAAPLPQAWLSQAAVGGCQRLCPPSQGGSLELREPAQRCQGGVPGEPACRPGRGTRPCLSAPSISTQLRAWVCVCCLSSQSSYYGWIIIAIVIPHNWTRLCCLQGTPCP